MITYADFEQGKRLAELSTFCMGGPARYFMEVKEKERLREVLLFAAREHLPFHVVGRGSNSLFPDAGFPGIVILNKIDFIEQKGPLVYVGAGYNFSLLGVQMARQGLSGLEFASGIPASVGGAIFMNAGANGGETSETLVSVEYLHPDGTLVHLKKEELTFGYRHSSFQSMSGVIVAAHFALKQDPGSRQRQLDIIQYRKKTQPSWQEPSIGCIFTNPDCASAGALIERAGLKGMQVGGVKVSEIHANFMVNTGQGSACDVLSLIDIVKERVFQATGVELKEEVRVVDAGI